MKALDTNVLVRFLVNDDPAQAQRARALLLNAEATNEPLMISNLVLLELIWVLDSGYRYDRADILDHLDRMTLMSALSFESTQLVRRFVLEAQASRMELPDLFIGLRAHTADCDTTLTFDRKAARSPYFSLIE